ncbi:MAG: hypothetical protein OEY93_05955 [Anaerolineae bacterium]|nr:hypothetical protein [Anaerolineae bacterium]
MNKNQERIALAGLIGIILIIITLPYYNAWRAGGDTHVFNGFIYNPWDGNSYIAKMRQGWNGSWTFKLPYTVKPGKGTYIYLYYLTIGHLARITGWSLLFTFHFFRILGVVALYLVLYKLCELIFDEIRPRWTAFLLAALGSGMGWIFYPLGIVTSDVGVPEIYPFYASLSSAHFPLSLALMVLVIILFLQVESGWKGRVGMVLTALLISIVTPFGTAIAGLTIGISWLWTRIQGVNNKNHLMNLFLFGLGIIPFSGYYFWLSQHHNAIQGWKIQNITITPPVWDTVAALSPLLWFAIPGGVAAWKSGKRPYRLLVVWLGLNLVMAYAPFALQRRMLTGAFIPLALLATMMVERWLSGEGRKARVVKVVFIILCVMTSVMNVFVGFVASKSFEPVLYLSRGEYEALDWMQENLPADSIILSSPRMGLYVPAYTDHRVLYGHPYETVNAEYWDLAVNRFFAGDYSADEKADFLIEGRVEYVFYGPRERLLGTPESMDGMILIYDNETVQIYEMGSE